MGAALAKEFLEAGDSVIISSRSGKLLFEGLLSKEVSSLLLSKFSAVSCTDSRVASTVRQLDTARKAGAQVKVRTC